MHLSNTSTILYILRASIEASIYTQTKPCKPQKVFKKDDNMEEKLHPFYHDLNQFYFHDLTKMYTPTNKNYTHTQTTHLPFSHCAFTLFMLLNTFFLCFYLGDISQPIKSEYINKYLKCIKLFIFKSHHLMTNPSQHNLYFKQKKVWITTNVGKVLSLLSATDGTQRAQTKWLYCKQVTI